MTRISDYYNVEKGERSSVSQNESAYDNAFRLISAQIEEEDRRKEEIEREESKKTYNMIISHIYEENRRNGDYSPVLTAIHNDKKEMVGDIPRNNTQALIINNAGTNQTDNYLTNSRGSFSLFGNNMRSTFYDNTTPNRNYVIPLTAGLMAAVEQNPNQVQDMVDSLAVSADAIKAALAAIPEKDLKEAADKGKNHVWNTIGKYVENLIDCMPMPPHVRVAVKVGYFFTITVCDALDEIKTKRAQELAWLESQTKYSEEEKKRYMQNKMIGWFLEEVGKGILDRILDDVLKEYKVPKHVSNQIKAMWSTFIVGDEWLGHWQPIIEREVAQIAPSLFTSADERYGY